MGLGNSKYEEPPDAVWCLTLSGGRSVADDPVSGNAGDAVGREVEATCVLPFCPSPMELLRLTLLFALTALAEIVGCYLPWLVVKEGRSLWLLAPAAVSLGLFTWLLTLHPSAAGRTYAAYGGMYIAVALLWLHWVDGVVLTRWDALGAGLALMGMAVIALQPQSGG